MKLDIFTLCDAATVSAGKMNVLGSFDTIRAREVPARNAACALAVKMRFDRIESGQKQLRITFMDADGKEVMPTIEMAIQTSAKTKFSTSTANAVVNIQSLKLERFGEYSIHLAIDGRLEGQTPLYVVQIESEAPPS
jgi:hypothetical protein